MNLQGTRGRTSIAPIPHHCTLKCVHRTWADSCLTRSCRAKQVSERWSQLELTKAGCIKVKLQALQNGLLVLMPSHLKMGRSPFISLPEMGCRIPCFPFCLDAPAELL